MSWDEGHQGHRLKVNVTEANSMFVSIEMQSCCSCNEVCNAVQCDVVHTTLLTPLCELYFQS